MPEPALTLSGLGFWFWFSMLTAVVCLFELILLILIFAIFGPILSAFASAKFGRGQGRAIIIPDRSGKAKLVTGEFTGSHLNTEKFGSIAWGDGAFYFYGLSCGVADPDIGAVMSPWMASKLQVLQELGFDNIKEIIKVHQMMDQGFTIDRINKRIGKLKDQQGNLKNLQQIRAIETRIKEMKRYKSLLEKAEEMGLKKKDFDNIHQKEPKIIDFKSLFNMVHYYINPKLTKIAETSARIDERKRLDQAGIGTDFMKWMGPGTFVIMLFSGIALAYIIITSDSGGGGGGGGSNTIAGSMASNAVFMIYLAYRSKIVKVK